MHIEWAHICKNAWEDEYGLTHISAIMSQVTAEGFPCLVGGRMIVYDVGLSHLDRGQRVSVKIDLVNETGEELWRWDAAAEFGTLTAEGEIPWDTPHAVAFLPTPENVAVPGPGTYAFRIWLGSQPNPAHVLPLRIDAPTPQ